MPLTRCEIVPVAGGFETGWQEVDPFDDLVASWAVVGAGDCEVTVQGRCAARETRPYVLGRRHGGAWTSLPGQKDDDAAVDVDRLVATRQLRAFRLDVRAGEGVRVVALAAVTALRPIGPAESRAPGPAVELAVEPLSQMAFAGRDTDLDGGGASWCSPAALTMVLRHHGIEVEVPEVARAVYDPSYGGCGNWSLNVAHAADRGLDAVVTRLRGLVDAAELLRAGLPVIASIAAGPGELPGFPLPGGTAGHLVVVAGITDDGDPVVLDPAAPDAATVRRVYPRAAFDAAWVGGTGGIAYVLRPPAHRLPPGEGRW
jgi:hypothetical protein